MAILDKVKCCVISIFLWSSIKFLGIWIIFKIKTVNLYPDILKFLLVNYNYRLLQRSLELVFSRCFWLLFIFYPNTCAFFYFLFFILILTFAFEHFCFPFYHLCFSFRLYYDLNLFLAPRPWVFTLAS